jgi:hypothetical protein
MRGQLRGAERVGKVRDSAIFDSRSASNVVATALWEGTFEFAIPAQMSHREGSTVLAGKVLLLTWFNFGGAF